ncbi:MAG: M23 family metallopeptidase [Clostridia bacterium]|jgi:murein DD-endopeptidase MepM/ murein hydrolase activator NlpD|nr:M23 family metallopeptidase [Clostridia bacterium]
MLNKPLNTLKAVFKITNVRFPRLNLPKIKPHFPTGKFRDGWQKFRQSRAYAPAQVLALGMALILLAGILQYSGFIGGRELALDVPPPPAEGENTVQVLPVEPKTPIEGSPTAPASVPLEIYPAPPVVPVAEELETASGSLSDGTKLKQPIQGAKVLGYGFHYSEIFDDYRLHPGLDISAARGTTVTAALAGTVEGVETSDFYGRRVIIDHGDGWKTIYSPLDKVSVRAGQKVSPGQALGTLDEPALAEKNRGVHLHFELWQDGEPIDPEPYL